MESYAPQEERWQVKLEMFEGPLDLLLHLVRKEEMDIRDIPIATIADEYLKYLDVLKDLDLNVAGRIPADGGQLVYLKSRVLIPRELLLHMEEGSGDEEDPEEVFYRELEEYQRFKEAARAAGRETAAPGFPLAPGRTAHRGGRGGRALPGRDPLRPGGGFPHHPGTAGGGSARIPG